MLSKAILSGFLLLLAGPCFAGTAEEMAEEHVRTYGGQFPIQLTKTLQLVGARSVGAKIALDIKVNVAKKMLSKSQVDAFIKMNRDHQCTEPTNRNLMGQGVAVEIKFIWEDGVTSSFIANSEICGVEKNEINAANGATIKDIIDSMSPSLPMKVDENTTLISLSKVGQVGFKYTFIVDASQQGFDAKRLKTFKSQLKHSVCNDRQLSLLMRSGVEITYSYQTKS